MPYSFVADSFHTKKLCSRFSSSEKHFLRDNGNFAFLSPLWGGERRSGLKVTYAVYLRLI